MNHFKITLLVGLLTMAGMHSATINAAAETSTQKIERALSLLGNLIEESTTLKELNALREKAHRLATNASDTGQSANIMQQIENAQLKIITKISELEQPIKPSTAPTSSKAALPAAAESVRSGAGSADGSPTTQTDDEMIAAALKTTVAELATMRADAMRTADQTPASSSKRALPAATESVRSGAGSAAGDSAATPEGDIEARRTEVIQEINEMQNWFENTKFKLNQIVALTGKDYSGYVELIVGLPTLFARIPALEKAKTVAEINAIAKTSQIFNNRINKFNKYFLAEIQPAIDAQRKLATLKHAQALEGNQKPDFIGYLAVGAGISGENDEPDASGRWEGYRRFNQLLPNYLIKQAQKYNATVSVLHREIALGGATAQDLQNAINQNIAAGNYRSENPILDVSLPISTWPNEFVQTFRLAGDDKENTWTVINNLVEPQSYNNDKALFFDQPDQKRIIIGSDCVRRGIDINIVTFFIPVLTGILEGATEHERDLFMRRFLYVPPVDTIESEGQPLYNFDFNDIAIRQPIYNFIFNIPFYKDIEFEVAYLKECLDSIEDVKTKNSLINQCISNPLSLISKNKKTMDVFERYCLQIPGALPRTLQNKLFIIKAYLAAYGILPE